MNLPDEVYYFDTYVAGRLYGDADKAWDALRVGQALQLRREPTTSTTRGLSPSMWLFLT